MSLEKIFCVCAVLSASGAAQAAVVYLKQGGHLEGTLLSSTGGALVIETAQGRVSVDLSRVKNVDYGRAPVPAPSDLPAPQALPAGSQMLSLDFGLAAPLNDVRLSGTAGGASVNDGATGPAFGLQYLYYASSRLGWGVEFDYFNRNDADSANLLPSEPSASNGEKS